MSIYQIFKQLEATSSTNDKIAILKENVNNEELKQALKLMLDDTCFFIKKIPEYGINSVGNISLPYAMNELSKLSSRKHTGNDGIEFLSSILSELQVYDAEVIMRIIKKDPNCGISDKTVNKVWKGLIKETPYMRCEKPSEIDRIKYPALIQTKSDGMFANIIVDNNGVVIKSRNGKLIDCLGILENKLKAILTNGYVYHGELLLRGKDGKTLDRKTGNGILNKAIKGTISEEEASAIYCTLWDILPIKDWEYGCCTDYNIDRFKQLQAITTKHYEESSLWTNTVANIIEYRMVNSIEEAQSFYQEQIDKGNEGAVIKNIKCIWENKTSKDCVKMKAENDCDLLCYDVIPHSKNPALIGALRCKSSDGKLVTDVGSGLNDELRSMPRDYFVDKVCAIKYTAISVSKSREEYSMDFPRLIEVRQDKSVADTLERILK